MSSRENAAVRSRDEIADAICALAPAQWARLRAVAHAYSYTMPAEDLLQEAFARALENDGRHCPADVDVVRFLAEAMRSIANGEYEKAKLRPSLIPLANHGDQQNDTDPPDPAIGAEDWLAREQYAALRRREILALFDDQPLARDIIQGRMKDMSPTEIRELTGLDATAYASQLKLIRRRIYNKFPKGWTS